LNISKKLPIILLASMLMVILLSFAAQAQDNPWDYSYSDEAAAGLFGLGLVCCIVPVIWFVICIMLAIWVYKDAEKRGSSGALWLIIFLITGFIGLIIWLIVRPPIGGDPSKGKATDGDRRCPNCGRNIPMDARACPYCAKKFEE
jgi:Na+/H+-dicarboxylate symporter